MSGVAQSLTVNILYYNVREAYDVVFLVLDGVSNVLLAETPVVTTYSGLQNLPLSTPVSITRGQRYDIAWLSHSASQNSYLGLAVNSATGLPVLALRAGVAGAASNSLLTLVGSNGIVSSYYPPSSRSTTGTYTATTDGTALFINAYIESHTAGDSYTFDLVDAETSPSPQGIGYTAQTNQTGLVSLPLLGGGVAISAGHTYQIAVYGDVVGEQYVLAKDTQGNPLLYVTGTPACPSTTISPTVPIGYTLVVGQLDQGQHSALLTTADPDTPEASTTYVANNSTYITVLVAQLIDTMALNGSTFSMNLHDPRTGRAIAAAHNIVGVAGQTNYHATVPPTPVLAGYSYRLLIYVTAGELDVATSDVAGQVAQLGALALLNSTAPPTSSSSSTGGRSIISSSSSSSCAPAGSLLSVFKADFTNHLSVAVDGAGHIYVLDSILDDADVVVLSQDDTVLSTINSTFSLPTALAVDVTNSVVYVADPGNDQVVSFSASGTQLQVFRGFAFPNCVAVDTAGNVYVTDFVLASVFVLSSGGTPLYSVSLPGGGPEAVVVDAAGLIYVSTSDNAVLV